MFDDDSGDYNPVEPFSRDEFAVHDDDELDDLDAGRDCDVCDREPCPHCGTMVRFRDDDEFGLCRKCGEEFSV